MSNSAWSTAATTAVPQVNPPPAYISQTEASNLISTELERQMIVSYSALTLVNDFLDQVLYSILVASRSISLASLKSAVPNVLKPRLGGAALRVAEEELKEYIEDDEEEEANTRKPPVSATRDFDLDLAFRLARLRCMVYTRLGDLEEEDEEEWLEKEQLLDAATAAQKKSKQSIAMGPSAAIFLTSVVEYLGEQALYYAAQHAQKRHDLALAKALPNAAPSSLEATRADDEIILDGKDMNHVGRDSPLSRLWRSWRRNTRSGAETGSLSRSISPEVPAHPVESPTHSRGTSNSMHPIIQPIVEEFHNKSNEASVVLDSPSQIPLPLSDRDVEEIEGVGTDAENGDPFIPLPERSKKRPTSLLIMPGQFSSQELSGTAEPPEYQERSPLRPNIPRTRSSSLPAKPTLFQTPEINTERKGAETDEEKDQTTKQKAEAGITQNAVSAYGSVTARSAEDSPLAAQPAVPKHETEENEEMLTKRESTQSNGMVNGAVAAVAGALSVVGVHHVADLQKSYHQGNTKAVPTSAGNGSLTGASITDFQDFDSMHVPVALSTPPDEREMPRFETGESRFRDRPLSTTGQVAGLAGSRAELEALSNKKQADSGKHQVTPVVDTVKLEAPTADKQPVTPTQTIYDQITTDEPVTTGHHNVILSSVPETMSETPAAAAVQTKGIVSPAFDSAPPPVVSQSRNRGQDDALHQHSPAGSRSSQMSHLSKSSSSSSRLLGFTRDGQGRPQTISQQRAAGAMADDVRAAHSPTLTGASRESGPGTSAEDVTSSPNRKRPHLRIRSESQDVSLKLASPGGATAEDKQRTLEVLINSDETLHYTLTPDTATFRPENAMSASPKRSQTQDLADFLKNTAPPGQDALRSGPPTKQHADRLGIDTTPARVSNTVSSERKIIPSSQNVTPITPSANKRPNPIGEPRDARIERVSSTRDLADYARSTGPSEEGQLPKLVQVPRPNTSRTGAAAVPGQSSARNGTLSSRAASRMKFQARDARPSRQAESSDLIDFIREGPPREGGEHRIDRQVAPFRSTMDSEDLNLLKPALNKETDAAAAVAAGSSAESFSLPQTIPPQTVPLKNGSTSNDKLEEDGMPKRTRRRVRDPYAIDDSEDDLEDVDPDPPVRQEESLIDFLRNTAPPSQETTAQPVLAAEEDHEIRRTSSIGRLRGLVARRSESPSPGNGTSSSSSRVQELRHGSSARAESPHLTQAGSRLDSYKPTQTTHAAHVDRNRGTKPHLETRTTSQRGLGDTADLAEYLRTTGPPVEPSSQKPLVPVTSSGSESGLKKLFSRRAR